VVATDLNSGEPVVFTQAILWKHPRELRFPGLFEPVEIGTRCLADGGLVALFQRAPLAPRRCTVIGVSVECRTPRGAPTNIFQVVSRR